MTVQEKYYSKYFSINIPYIPLFLIKIIVMQTDTNPSIAW